MSYDKNRYSCQINLPGFGVNAQKKLSKSKVLIVGAGGLGCPVGLYLGSSGVGTIGIVDFDTISLSNLHRQILYGDNDCGLAKVDVAKERLSYQNPNINIIPIREKVLTDNVLALIKSYEIVVDCSDNFDTRYLLNDACVTIGIPLVYGAIFKFEGQVSVFNIINANGTKSPNYRDLFKQNDKLEVPNCSDAGVLPTLTGIIGCIQATEVIKYLTGIGELLASKLLIFDALTMESKIINLPKVSVANIPPFHSRENKSPIISVGELKRVIQKNIYQLVDVRSKEENHEYNIGGINIPLEKIIYNDVKVDSQKPTIFYCATGVRSSSAVKHILEKIPDAKVYSLEGGVIAYKSF